MTARAEACQQILEIIFAFSVSRSVFRGSDCRMLGSRSRLPDVRIAVVSSPNGQDGSWTLLTSHGHVLVEVARNPDARMRDISAAVGLTERAVQTIVTDLESAGYLTRNRVGRRNRYTVNPGSDFRHHAQAGIQVGPFLELLTSAGNADHQRLTTSSPR